MSFSHLLGKELPNSDVEVTTLKDEKIETNKTKLHDLIKSPCVIYVQPGASSTKCVLHPKWMETVGAAGCTGEARLASTSREVLAKRGYQSFILNAKLSEQHQLVVKDHQLQIPMISVKFDFATALQLPTGLPKDETNLAYQYLQRVALIVDSNKKIIGVIPGRAIKEENAKTAELVIEKITSLQNQSAVNFLRNHGACLLGSNPHQQNPEVAPTAAMASTSTLKLK